MKRIKYENAWVPVPCGLLNLIKPYSPYYVLMVKIIETAYQKDFFNQLDDDGTLIFSLKSLENLFFEEISYCSADDGFEYLEHIGLIKILSFEGDIVKILPNYEKINNL